MHLSGIKHYHMPLAAESFSSPSSAPTSYCQTLFSVLCVCPYFTVSVQCAGHIVWESHSQLKSLQDFKKRKKKLEKALLFKIAQQSAQQQGQKPFKSMTWRYTERICYIMTVWWHEWEAVQNILLNLSKKKWLMGTFSHSQNKERFLTKRIILSGGFSRF